MLSKQYLYKNEFLLKGAFLREVSRKPLFLVFLLVALVHIGLIIFFHFDIRLGPQSKIPDLEIELASNFQSSGNANSTSVARQVQSSKDNQKTTKTSSSQSNKVSADSTFIPQQQNNLISGSSVANVAGTSSSTQIAGDVPTSSDTYGPKLLNNPKPKYPSEAYRQRKEGTVILYVQVLDSGAVGQLKIGVSSGVDSLDESAVEAVKEWKFSPGKSNGRILAQWIKVPITYNLKNR